jgi:hypothetical protein
MVVLAQAEKAGPGAAVFWSAGTAACNARQRGSPVRASRRVPVTGGVA